MSFPVEVTSVLTGASPSQLAYWRRTSLLTPEVERRPAALYSFRDLIALRTFVRLREATSLQSIRRALSELDRMDLTEHPAHYQLVSHGNSIVLVEDDRQVDLVAQPGQEVLANLANIFAPFTNRQGRVVVDFRRPRRHLEVREHRMGGWPTIGGTRIPYETIAELAADGSVDPDDVRHYYPTVNAAAVEDAVSFAQEVNNARLRKSRATS